MRHLNSGDDISKNIKYFFPDSCQGDEINSYSNKGKRQDPDTLILLVSSDPATPPQHYEGLLDLEDSKSKKINQFSSPYNSLTKNGPKFPSLEKFGFGNEKDLRALKRTKRI